MPELIDQPVQGAAALIGDVVVGCEDEVGEPVVAEELPDIFLGFSSGHCVCSGLGGDFGEMLVHGGGVTRNNAPHDVVEALSAKLLLCPS